MIPLLYEPFLREALREDLGRAGDITTDAIVPATLLGHADAVGRAAGIVSGLEPFARTFTLVDERVSVLFHAADGDRIEPGTPIARVSGPLRAILAAERTALNPVSYTHLDVYKRQELHAPNFRRLVAESGIVERTGAQRRTSGRPAETYRFRPDVLAERPDPGIGIR